MIKKLSVATLITVGLMISPISIYAQTGANSASTAGQTRRGAVEQQRVTGLKTRAGNEIDRRIASLNKLMAKINGIQKLSTDQKSKLASQIQNYITELTNLKAKIDAETDLATIKADVKSVVTNYRIYALFMPEINELLAIDRVSIVADKLSNVEISLQGKGGDQALLTDMQNKITDAKSLLQAAQAEITPLTPAGYPGNRTTLQDARAKIKSAGQDLRMAWQEAQKIKQEIKASTNPSAATPSSK